MPMDIMDRLKKLTHEPDDELLQELLLQAKEAIKTVTEFERIAESPQALAAFLRALPVVEAPWDTAFQKRYCAGCAAKDCDTCPNEAYRNNPAWWLAQTATEERGRLE